MGIWDEIVAVRAEQLQEHGGPDHDDNHDRIFWIQLIVEFATGSKARHGTIEKFRHTMLHIAAIAIAAIEWADRRINGA